MTNLNEIFNLIEIASEGTYPLYEPTTCSSEDSSEDLIVLEPTADENHRSRRSPVHIQNVEEN